MKSDTEVYSELIEALCAFLDYVDDEERATDTSRDVFLHLAILTEVLEQDSMKTSDLVGRCANLISIGSSLMCRLEPSYLGSDMHQLCCNTIKYIGELCDTSEFQISYWVSKASGQ